MSSKTLLSYMKKRPREESDIHRPQNRRALVNVYDVGENKVLKFHAMITHELHMEEFLNHDCIMLCFLIMICTNAAP